MIIGQCGVSGVEEQERDCINNSLRMSPYMACNLTMC